MNKITKEEMEAINKAIDEVYSYYEMEHSMAQIRFIHPMFYNGTFSKNNEYQPLDPGQLLTRDEFKKTYVDNYITNSKWTILIEFMGFYFFKNRLK